jgi:hypothetical protein
VNQQLESQFRSHVESAITWLRLTTAMPLDDPRAAAAVERQLQIAGALVQAARGKLSLMAQAAEGEAAQRKQGDPA